MKYFYLLLLFSSFSFGQNVEYINMMQNTNKDIIETLIKDLNANDYQFVDFYKNEAMEGIYEYYEYKNNKQEELKISFITNEGHFTFSNMIGKCNLLLPFWKNKLHFELPLIKTGERITYSYDSSSINYYLNSMSTKNITCQISNQNSLN